MSMIVKLLLTDVIVFLVSVLIMDFFDETDSLPVIFEYTLVAASIISFIAIPVLGIALIWIS